MPPDVAEPQPDDPTVGPMLGFWLSLATTLTGAAWWNFAGGSAQHWHPGVLGVIVTPVAAVATVAFAAGWLRARRKRARRT